MNSEQPQRRKRVSALVPPDQHRRLEEMARESREPVSLVVGRIIKKFLSGEAFLSRSGDDASGNTGVEPCACDPRADRYRR